jgi:tol-pal system protein YbgF
MMQMGLSRRRTTTLRAMKATSAIVVATVSLAFTPASSIAGPSALRSGQFAGHDVARSGLHQVQSQQNPTTRARELAYIGRLEEQIRQLTGRIEQLEYDQRNADRRIDQLIEDLDQRLRRFEQGGVSNPDLAQGPGLETGELPANQGGNPPLSPNERGLAEQALSDLAAAAPQPAPADGQLGSVPESALASLPRPNPADVAAPKKSTLTPEQQYENAVQLLQAGDYQGAQGGLELFLDINAEHQLASNAAYWLAETHYVRQNYSAAAAAFARNYRNYGKDSAKAIDNLLKLGMSLSNLGEQEKACLTYEELNNAFPKRPAHIQQALSRERARAQCG